MPGWRDAGAGFVGDFERPLRSPVSPPEEKFMPLRSLSTVAAVATLALLTACVAAPRRDVVYEPAVGQMSAYAEFGKVESIAIVPASARTSGGGAVLGAVIGGIVGHQFGGGIGKGVATGVGVVGGAAAGNAIEGRNLHEGDIVRVQVRFDNGTSRPFDFMRIDDLRVGDRVKFEGGQLHRL
jgi:outer membrane lipoprotein SlyB